MILLSKLKKVAYIPIYIIYNINHVYKNSIFTLKYKLIFQSFTYVINLFVYLYLNFDLYRIFRYLS